MRIVKSPQVREALWQAWSAGCHDPPSDRLQALFESELASHNGLQDVRVLWDALLILSRELDGRNHT